MSVSTCAVAHALVLDNVLVLQRLENLDLSLKVAQVLRRAVLEFLHCYDLAGVVLQWVIPAHFHAAKVSLEEQKNNKKKKKTLVIGVYIKKVYNKMIKIPAEKRTCAIASLHYRI